MVSNHSLFDHSPQETVDDLVGSVMGKMDELKGKVSSNSLNKLL